MEMKKIIRNVILILAVSAIVLVIVTNVEKVSVANVIKEQREQVAYQDQLVDNCDCIERERLKCFEGFELNIEKRRCEKDKIFTNVLLGCSKYNCSEGIHEFNFDTEKWQIEIN